MPRREIQTAVGEYYHVYNRGVEKRVVFQDGRDYQRCIEIASYYLNPKPAISFSQRDRIQIQELDSDYEPLVDIVAYCLMPNHFHYLVRVNSEAGLVTWIRRFTNSYTHAFNERTRRVGPLFQGPYKIVHVTTNDQLLHLSRYIHLNPVVARLSQTAREYRWSSMKQYLDIYRPAWLRPAIILEQFSSPEQYEEFVNDYAAYASEVHQIKKLLIEEE